MYACACVCVCMFVCACVYACACVRVCMYGCACVCVMHACMCVCLCMLLCACFYVCVIKNIYLCKNAKIQIGNNDSINKDKRKTFLCQRVLSPVDNYQEKCKDLYLATCKQSQNIVKSLKVFNSY